MLLCLIECEVAKLEAAVDKVLMKLFVCATPPSILRHTHMDADNCEKLEVLLNDYRLINQQLKLINCVRKIVLLKFNQLK